MLLDFVFGTRSRRIFRSITGKSVSPQADLAEALAQLTLDAACQCFNDGKWHNFCAGDKFTIVKYKTWKNYHC